MADLNAEVKIRVEEEIREALERIAAREDRKPAAIARRLLREGLVAAGELEAAASRG